MVVKTKRDYQIKVWKLLTYLETVHIRQKFWACWSMYMYAFAIVLLSIFREGYG